MERSTTPGTAAPASQNNCTGELRNAPNRGQVDVPEILPRRGQSPTVVRNREHIGKTPPSTRTTVHGAEEAVSNADAPETLPVEATADSAPKSYPDDAINVHAGNDDPSQNLGQWRESPQQGKDLSIAPIDHPSRLACVGDDYIVDRVIAHRYDGKGLLVFRVRWYGYTPEDDTENPITHLRRSHVICYCKRKELKIPDSINRARQGQIQHQGGFYFPKKNDYMPRALLYAGHRFVQSAD